MGSLFTFALGAVSALILVPVLVKSRHRHRHSHSASVKRVAPAKRAAGGKGGAKAGRKKGK